MAQDEASTGESSAQSAQGRQGGQGGQGAQDARAAVGVDPAKRRRFTLIAVVVVAAVVVAAAVWWLIERNYESTDDAYIDTRLVYLSPQVAGRVLHVYANDNVRVQKGELLVEIDPANAQARVDQAQAQVAQATAQLAAVNAQLRVSEANDQRTRAAVTGAAAQAANAARDLARYRGLNAAMPSAVAVQQFDQARMQAVHTASEREVATLDAKAAAQQVDAARTQIAVAQAQIKAAQAGLQQARLNLGYTRIVAPCDGTVANRSVAVGDYVQAGEDLLAIVPFDIWITANFKETQLDEMRLGEKVDIGIDAYPGVKFAGHVDSIQRGAGQAFSVLPAQNATGNFIKVVQRVPVKILIDRPALGSFELGPGMSVRVRVHVR
ncbi:MAG: efflux RND transporter periplasmic adaptor subunit [Steroidobacteraceae bacterium]